MKAQKIIIAAIIAAATLASAHAEEKTISGPSFNCAYAKTPDEVRKLPALLP